MSVIVSELAGIAKERRNCDPQQFEVEDATGGPEQLGLSDNPALLNPREKASTGGAIGPKYTNPDFIQLKVYVRRKTN